MRYSLLFLFLFVLGFRLFFVFQTPYYSGDTSYLNLRIIEHIKENFKPMVNDELGLGGRTLLLPQFFHYTIALLSFIPYAYKIVPSILMSTIVIVVYLVSLKISGSKKSAMFSAMMAGFIPIVYSTTLNNISVHTMSMPMIFLAVYSFMRLEEKPYLVLFTVLSFVLPLVHPLTFLLSFSLLFYVLLMASERMKIINVRKEALVFFIFVTFVIEFVIYRKALLALGTGIIRQNIPAGILSQYFKNINLLDVIYQIGILPFILGTIAIIIGFFYTKKSDIMLLIGIALSAFLLLSFKMVPFKEGLMLLGIVLAVMSSTSLSKLYDYIRLTKVSGYSHYFSYMFVLLIALLLVIPSFFAAEDAIAITISDQEFQALEKIRTDTDENATVLATIDEGHYITAIAKRKNVIDNHFLYAKGIDRRYAEVNEIFTTMSGSKALEYMHRYGISYIYFSKRAKEIYKINSLGYTNDQNCFRKIASVGENEVYKIRC